MNDVKSEGAPRDIRRSLRISGALFCIAGAISIVLPGLATLAVEVVFAWLLILAAIAALTFAWQHRDMVDWWFQGLIGLLALAAGLLLLFNPGVGARTLTMILIALFLIEGVTSFVVAGRLRGRLGNTVWIILSGIASIALALLLLAGWPGTAAWALGLLFGVNLLSTGVSLVMIANAIPK